MASSREFVYFDRNGKPSKPVSFATVMIVAAKRLVTGRGQWHIKQDEHDYGRFRKRRETLRRFRTVVSSGDVGSVYRIENERGTNVMKVREVKKAVHVINTNGNQKADVYWSAAKSAFSYIHFLGAYVCKRIVGSYTLSQHSYGNAVDIGAPTMAQLYKIAAWALNNADRLHLEHIIVANHIWTRGNARGPVSSWPHYSGEYHYHVHADFDPNFSGGCGVRG